MASSAPKSLVEKKNILKNQIEKLNSLKNELKGKIDTFKEIDENNVNSVSFATSFSGSEISNSVDINIKIKNELINFTGIRCIKNTKEEFIFQILSEEDSKRNIYFAQFFKRNDELELGKWKFPPFLDINDILDKTPTDNSNWICQFLQKCKQYIDCYHSRMDQYLKLKNSMEENVNCFIYTDQEYVFISIKLLKVYDIKLDNYVNIILYLQYNSNEARPYGLKVESYIGPPLSQETEKDLKLFFKPFLRYDLTKAVEILEKNENPLFDWKRIMKEQLLTEEMSPDTTPQKRQRLITSKTSKQKALKNKNSKKKSLKLKSGTNTTNSMQKRSTVSRRSNTDISKYFPKTNESEIASKPKNMTATTEDKSKEKESAITLKQVSVKLRNLESSTEDSKEQNTSKEPVSKEMEKLDNAEEEKVLKSTKTSNHPKEKTNSKHNVPKNTEPLRKLISPKKVDLSKKLNSTNKGGLSRKLISPKNAGPAKRLVSPNKVVKSKQLKNVKKLISPSVKVSSKTSNIKMKQTNLQVQYPDDNSASRKSSINLNYNVKNPGSKLVTSTPLPVKSKITNRSPVTDFNVSEIRSSKAIVQLKRLQAIKDL